MQDEIRKAVEVLRSGGIILYPTDTVWGIGCDATNEQAVEKIYRLKQSVNKKGMIVLIDKIDNVARYINKVPEIAWDLYEAADKPLTLILPTATGVAQNLIPEEGSLAIRIPKHEFCQKLISRLGHPLVSTSANISGQTTPTGFDDISDQIKNGVDMVIDPIFEGLPTRSASSIILLAADGTFKIIR